MRNFWAFSSICVLVVILIDRLLISRIPYIQYVDYIEVGFELNKLANTLRLEGVRIFIGLVPVIILGSTLFNIYTHLIKNKIGIVKSFTIFLHFLYAIIALNIVGGIVYYICTLVPYINSVNKFFSDLILIRIYINFPFIAGFKYENCYIAFSVSNLMGLFLLKTKYFREAWDNFLGFFRSGA